DDRRQRDDDSNQDNGDCYRHCYLRLHGTTGCATSVPTGKNCPSSTPATLVNVCKHFSNRLIKFRWNLLLDADAAIQSAVKRHIFDGGNVMFPTQFFD